jgi:DNA-binding GntR family transcriptional regulator
MIIKHEKLSDQVYRHLLEEILAGRLPPGTILHEIQIAKQLGVSRTPIREAVWQLAAQGLAVLRANRSAIVPQLLPDHIRQIYQVREILEGKAAELACPAMTGADFQYLETLAAAVQDPEDPACREAYHRFDLELHRLVALRSGNSVLAAEIEKYLALNRLVGRCVVDQPGAPRLAHEQHVAIIEALKTRKPVRARLAMVTHIRDSGEVVVRFTQVTKESGESLATTG